MKQLSLFPEKRKAKMTLGELPENQYLNREDSNTIDLMKSYLGSKNKKKGQTRFSYQFVHFSKPNIIAATDGFGMLLVKKTHKSNGYFDKEFNELNIQDLGDSNPFDFRIAVNIFENKIKLGKEHNFSPLELLNFQKENKDLPSIILKGIKDEAFVFNVGNKKINRLLTELNALKLEAASIRFRKDNLGIKIEAFSKVFDSNVELYYSGLYFVKTGIKSRVETGQYKGDESFQTSKYFNIINGFKTGTDNDQTQKAQAQAQRLRLLNL